MTALVTRRLNHLAETIADLKEQVRTAIATELGRAVGTAVRDVLVIALTGRFVATAIDPYPPSGRGWDDTASDDWNRERHSWDESPIHSHDEDNPGSQPDSVPVPAAVAIAVGVHVGRWWLIRRGGNLAGSVGIGILVTSLGLAGGAAAQALIAVLTATADVMTATTLLEARRPELSGRGEFDESS